MSVHDVDVAVRYTLSTVDRGVRQAVSLSQNLTRETRSAQKELDTALRSNSAAWKDTARVAASSQRQVTEAAASASSQVDKSMLREIESLRKAGVGYKEISAAARGWGASAQETAAAVKRAADEEIRQIDRVVASRNKLRSMVGLSAKTPASSRGRSGAGVEERGLETGATRAAAGKLRSGVSYLGAGLVGGLVGYAGVEGVKQAVDSTKDLALQTRTLSAVTGMDSKTASEWVAITQARDIKTRTFAQTLKTLSTQTEGATSGSKKSVQAFKDLGISTDDLKQHSGDLSSLLGLVADHLNKMPGGAEKTAIASQLLGRNWTALQPVLLEGSKGMADQRKEAAALGVTLGGNAAENAKKLEEASVSLKIAQEGLEVQFAEHVAPALIKVTEGGIKLFGVLRQDLGPAFHTVTGEVRDVSHWLEEHKTVLKAVEVALGGVAAGYVGLKVISGTVRLVRGVASDFMTAKNAITGVAHPLQALKGLFGEQESESQALMRSQTALAEANERLAKSFDQVAASSKGAAGGEALAGEESGLAGGAPILGRGKGALGEEKTLAGEEATLAGGGGKGITAAEKLGTAAETEIAQTGMWGMLLGRQGEETLTSRLASLGSGLMKGAGVGIGGVLGSQLIGGAIGGKTGKTVAGIGTAASIGAGAGMLIGPEGALAGAGIGAATAGLNDLFGGGDNSSAVKKLQKQMEDAASRDDWKKLQQLADNATSASRGLQALGKTTTSQDLKKLGSAAQKTASSLQLQSAGKAVTGIESSIAGSKFAPSVSQITKATTSQLSSLGPQAQKAGAAAIVKFTAGLESQKRLPVGSTDKLIRQLEAEYGPAFASTLQKSGTQSMKAFENTVAKSKVVSKVQDQVDQMHKQWGLLVPDVTVTSKNIEQVMTSNIEAMRNKVLNTTGQEQQDAIGHLNALLALYSKYSPLIAASGASAFTSMAKTVSSTLGALGHTIGGSLGGWVTLISQFASAVTPALSSIAGAIQGGALATPSGAQNLSNTIGNVLTTLGAGKAEGGYFHGVVPGDHTRDGTLAWLSGREFVMTGPGQQMMDAYAPGLLDHIAASQAPHFAKGGAVGGSVWNVRASAEESSSGIGWTELSTNGNAAAVSGHPHTATHSGGWDFSTLGRMYPKGTKLRIASGARSGIFPLTDYGDGSSFAPAIGLTPAVQSALGGMPSTVDISLADGSSIALASGFGRLVSGSVSADGSAKKGKGVGASLQPNTKTTYKPVGPGLGDGYYQGYEYGLDPTTGVGGPAALKAATLGSQLKAVTTSVPSPVKFTLPTIAGGKIPKSLQGNKRALGVDQAMMKAASQIIGLPYGSDHVGGHGAWNHGSYDCSGAVGYLLHAAGLTDSFQWTGSLASWGLPGDGKYVTVGLRDPQSQDNGHTMINFFGKYLESGGGGPLGKPSVHWDSGWDGNFPYHRHPPGLRRGGRIPRFAKGGPVGGHSTGRPWPSNRNEADSKRATFMAPQHGTVDDRWRHRRRYARGGFVGAGAAGTFLPPQPVLPPSLTYQPVMAIAQPVAPPAASFYGTHTAAGEPRALRRETSSISAAGTNQQAAHALSQLSKTVDNVKKVAYTSLLSEAKELQKAAAAATKSGDKQQATRLKQAYQLVTNEAGRRVGALVKAATDEGSALTAANQRLQNMLTRNQIDPASAQGTAFIAKFQDQSVKVIKNEVSKLQKAYELAKKAGNQRAAADAGSKLQQALSDLDDATAAAVQDHVDQVNAAKQAVADAAQSTVDTATHDVTMASSGETALEDRQQLAGTSGTAAGAQQLSDYINQSVVPAMQKQVAALQAQEGVAQQQGNTTLAQQIAEQIADAQNGILQSQLDAQQAIQAATQATAENTQELVGNLGVTYDNGTYANLAGALNGT